MSKSYEQPNVRITLLKDDVIRTSTLGVGKFSVSWLVDNEDEEFTTGD